MSKFKFCPMCRGMMKFKMPNFDHIERNTCIACGYVDYDNSKPTSSALILNDKNEILLVKRAWHPYKGLWDVPGGFIEGGEHPEDACRREVLEELGVEVELDGFFDMEIDVYTDGTDESAREVSGHGVHVLSIFYKAHIVSGDIKPTDEIGGYEWFSIEEVSGMIPQIAFKANQKVIKKFIT